MANYTQGQLDALRAAAVRGVSEVTYDGETVKYRSVNEMFRLISIMERDIAASTTTRRVFGASNGMR